MKQYQNDPEIFPELRETHLKIYAKRWVKKYKDVPIESIILYRCHSVYQEYLKEQENLKELNDIMEMKMKAPTKYALIFNISLEKLHDQLNKLFDQTAQHYDVKPWNYSHCEIFKIMELEDYRYFLIDTEYFDVHRWRTPFLSFIDSVFPRRVYKDNILLEDNFRDEWIIQPKTSNDEFYRNVMTDEPYWTLYDDSGLQEEKGLIEQEATHANDTIDQNNIAFYQEGDFWKIGKRGSESTFKDLKGFKYIAFLIRHKNDSFKPLEVYYLGNVPDEYKYINEVDFQKIGNTSELGKYIKFLEEKLTTETDHDKRIEISHKIFEFRKIKNEGIKAFKQKSDSCRQAVYKAIQTAAKKIQKEFPTLKEYFNYGRSEVIKTGSTFSYQQDNFALSIHWVLGKPS